MTTDNDPGKSPYDRQMDARRRGQVREGIIAAIALVALVVFAAARYNHGSPQNGDRPQAAQAR
jgi:hypothetical protein